VRRNRFQQKADDLAAARARGEISDDEWFKGMAAIFDVAYPAGDNPRAQSGFGGNEARWEAGRRPIAEQIDRDGTFIDIGCANGYLLEASCGGRTTTSSHTVRGAAAPKHAGTAVWERLVERDGTA
jgi:hypothetical protein